MENNLPVIVTLRMTQDDFEAQPSLFGPSFEVVRSPHDVIFFAALKSLDQMRIVRKMMPDVIKFERSRTVHTFVARDKIAVILREKRLRLLDYQSVPWGRAYSTKLVECGQDAIRVENGTADIESLFRSVNEVQSHNAGRVVTFIREAEKQIELAKAGTMIRSSIPVPEVSGHPSHVWLAAADSIEGVIERNYIATFNTRKDKTDWPREWTLPYRPPFTIFETGVNEFSTDFSQVNSIATMYFLQHAEGEFEVFHTAKDVFLRRERLMRKKS